MITIGEAIQRVQSLYSKGLQSKDSRLTPRHIYSAIITARGVLLQQKYNKNQEISRWNYQTLNCVELIEATPYECSCVPASGCKLLRSKEKIPQPITGIDRDMFKSVSTLDGSITFDLYDADNVKYAKGNKYTSVKPRAYFFNNYLFITETKKLRAINIPGLFADPTEVYDFPSVCGGCEDCNCYDPMDKPFPIDRELLRPLVQLANEELIVMFKQMSEDKMANAADDDSMKSGMVHQPNDQQ